MAILSVPRAFGGTLILTITPPVTIGGASFTCVTRDMQAIAKTRDMQAKAVTRDEKVTAKTRG